MKTKVCLVLAGIAAAITWGAPPAPPVNPINPLLPPPTNAVVLTNVTSVYKNVAVKTPTVDFQDVTVYGTNFTKGSVTLSWDKNSEPDLEGYILSYGPAAGSTTNEYATKASVNVVMFFSIFQPGNTYWFYVRAYNTSGFTSGPSNVIIVSP